MSSLTRQRCWIHLEREAAARCPQCANFYCRECVTEHEGRLVCAGCLRDLLATAANTRRRGLGSRGRLVLAGITRTGQVLGSVVAAWIFFQMFGQWLLSTATQFHESNVWTEQFFGGGSEGGNTFNKDKNDPQRDKDDDEDDEDEPGKKDGAKKDVPDKKDDDAI